MITHRQVNGRVSVQALELLAQAEICDLVHEELERVLGGVRVAEQLVASMVRAGVDDRGFRRSRERCRGNIGLRNVLLLGDDDGLLGTGNRTTTGCEREPSTHNRAVRTGSG